MSGEAVNPFESIIGGSFAAAEIYNMTSLEVNAADYVQKEHPYISQGTDLYNKAIELEIDYLGRDSLISQPHDADSSPDVFDGEEWALTEKRRNFLHLLCKQVLEDVKFNLDDNNRRRIVNMHAKIVFKDIDKDYQWQQISENERDELKRHTIDIWRLLRHDVNNNFQTV